MVQLGRQILRRPLLPGLGDHTDQILQQLLVEALARLLGVEDLAGELLDVFQRLGVAFRGREDAGAFDCPLEEFVALGVEGGFDLVESLEGFAEPVSVGF